MGLPSKMERSGWVSLTLALSQISFAWVGWDGVGLVWGGVGWGSVGSKEGVYEEKEEGGGGRRRRRRRRREGGVGGWGGW